MGRGLDVVFSIYPGRGAVFKPLRGTVSPDFGGNSERETPLPIPNRAVKPLSADGTWPARAWESRSPPVLPDDEPPLGAAFRVLRPRLAGVEGRFTPPRRG